MPIPSNINPIVDELHIGNSGTNNVVTQLTGTTTAVVCNAKAGTIHMFAPQNLAAGAEISFEVKNNRCTSSSVVIPTLVSANVGGTPFLYASRASNGSFTMTISNLHASVAETGTLVANFVIIDTN